MTTSDTISFEKAMQELNEIVEMMEKGDLDLDKSLKQFERGVQLTRHCQKALQDAEQKIKILAEDNGQELQDFELKGDE